MAGWLLFTAFLCVLKSITDYRVGWLLGGKYAVSQENFTKKTPVFVKKRKH